MEIDTNSSAIVLSPEEAYELLIFEPPTSLRTSLESELKAALVDIHTKPFVAIAVREQLNITTNEEARQSLREAGKELVAERLTIHSLRRILFCSLTNKSILKNRLRISVSQDLTLSLLHYYKTRAEEAARSRPVSSDITQLIRTFITPAEYYRERVSQLESVLAKLALTNEIPSSHDNAAAETDVAVVEDR